MPDIATVIADHRWHPHRVNAEVEEMQFVRLERQQHRDVTFLEEKYLPADVERANFKVTDVAEAAEALPQARADFVFHSSLALSTLTARLFDMPGVSMSLKEPIILNEIAQLSRRGNRVTAILTLIMRLLARPYGPGERVVIKPGNTANVLIPELMTIVPDARALFMYAPLPDFLGSVARKGMWGRIVYRRLFALLVRDGHLDAGFSDADTFEQTDLQIAALTWLNHHAQFAHFLAEPFGDRVRTIDAGTFLAKRRVVVAAIAAHFGLAFDIDAVLAGPVFNEHSKQLGRTFDFAERDRENAENAAAFGEEIGMVVEWAEKTFEACGETMALGNRLVV